MKVDNVALPEGRPSLFRRAWEGWKRIAKKIGDFQSRLILILFYFVILAPFELLLKIGSDTLHVKSRSEPLWRARHPDERTHQEKALRQF
jgi:hypothetical protein